MIGCEEECRQGSSLTALNIARAVVCLLFFDSAVVVEEDKGAFVLGVNVALSALVPRAQVA